MNEYSKYKLFRKYKTEDGVKYTPLDEYQALSDGSTNNCDCGYREYEWRISDPIEGDECDGIVWYEWAYCPTDDTIKEKTGNTKRLSVIEWNGYDLSVTTNIGYHSSNKKEEIGFNEYRMEINGYIKSLSVDFHFTNFFKLPSTSNVTNMSSLFYGCANLSQDFTELKCWDTSNVTNMSKMFYDCEFTTEINVSNFNTSKVTDMSYMFAYCRYLTSLDLSSFDTSNVTNMYRMFYNCSGLTSLDVSSFNTSAVTNMEHMFLGCSGLTSLNVSSFDTSKITFMGSMFQNCYSLTSLDLSSFNTSNVTDINGMFWDCRSLTTLDLSGWDTSKVSSSYEDNTWTFANTQSLKTIIMKGCSNETISFIQKIVNYNHSDVTFITD